MKIIVTEFSSGFADSTVPLCNALIEENPKNQIFYLSDKSNPYLKNIDNRVKTILLYDTFQKGKAYKKGTLLWLSNRIWVSVINAIKRNQFVKKKKPDIILVMATLSSIDQFFLGKMKRYGRVFMTVHDVLVPQKSLSWGRRALKRTYDIADGLIVHSLENKQQMILDFHIPESKIQVIHHGIEKKVKKLEKESCRKQTGLNPDVPVLLFYGGIRQSKGLDVLIKGLKNISCQLLIAGSMPYGESFEKYEHLLKENKIQCVKYIEFTSDDFRDVLFQASDFVVLPYKEFSSQSGVFMQAIRYGKPVIATDVSSFKSYIDQYHMGYVCKPNDIKALHLTIRQALDQLKQGIWEDTALMERAAEENSWQRSAKLYLTYFSKIYNQNHQKAGSQL